MHDPNRAHSDLRIANGFANFLIEKKDKKRVIQIKLDVKKLFTVYASKHEDEFIQLFSSELRKTLSKEQKSYLHKQFKDKCNITGIKLYQEDKQKGNLFFKKSLTPSYDHRRPLSKGGTNDISNWQLISKLANDEKNKICNICDIVKCEECALAYPEKFNIILPTGQDISELRRKARKIV